MYTMTCSSYDGMLITHCVVRVGIRDLHYIGVAVVSCHCIDLLALLCHRFYFFFKCKTPKPGGYFKK